MIPLILDYGVGNLGSIKNMVRKIGYNAQVNSTAASIKAADIIILPGVGSFDSGVTCLRDAGLVDLLNQRVLEDKVPVLGICLGAQLMTKSSQEGTLPGLGWLDATTLKFDHSQYTEKYPLPNIGWRDVFASNGYELLSSINQQPRFYFVHSYYLCPSDPTIVSLSSRYGFEFACGLHKDNIHCVQFHPEKSHMFGIQFFRNFFAKYI